MCVFCVFLYCLLSLAIIFLCSSMVSTGKIMHKQTKMLAVLKLLLNRVGTYLCFQIAELVRCNFQKIISCHILFSLHVCKDSAWALFTELLK